MNTSMHRETEKRLTGEEGRRGKRTVQKRTQARRQRYRRHNRFLGLAIKVSLGLSVALVVLGVIFFLSNGGTATSKTAQSGAYAFVVGNPGPGDLAPPIQLPSTTGKTFDLAAMHGKTVLLFFQEGLGCQSCWTQIKDMEAQMGSLRALGIDMMVSITTNPLDTLKQEVVNDGISTPILSDQNLAVSRAYHADQYGMMNGSSDGHSFLIVGPDGRIRWRADYGGPPNYTMYVPIATLVANMREGLNGK
jgi:peroxiredoxin